MAGEIANCSIFPEKLRENLRNSPGKMQTPDDIRNLPIDITFSRLVGKNYLSFSFVYSVPHILTHGDAVNSHQTEPNFRLLSLSVRLVFGFLVCEYAWVI